MDIQNGILVYERGSVMNFAHLRLEKEEVVCQPAAEHCRNTARYTAMCLHEIGLYQTGTLIGLVHDCGKFKREFQDYLMDPNAARGTVNHTFAGVRLLLDRYHNTDDEMKKIAAEMMAFAVGSHHGMFDCVDEHHKFGFLHRLNKKGIGYKESKRNFLKECVSEEELDSLFEHSLQELGHILQIIAGDGCGDQAENAFQIGLLARLLLSALIEGDRRDTAEFMLGHHSLLVDEDLHLFWGKYLDRLEKKLSKLPSDTPICKARREISNRCRRMAEGQGGIYRLNAPTGSGKTLSSLRYALAHAAKWGKRRLIFTAPLLSILEQNAAVIRDFLEDDGIILEHHSNVLRTSDGDELDQRELATESWNAPVIITTLVQLLNTLFQGKTTSIRRFQGLCNSVIVIDEVQTVPLKMLSLFNLAIDFLAKVCGATVLLCSATQPCLEKTAHPLRGNVQDVLPYDKELWKPFCRTNLRDAGEKTLEEIVAFAESELETSKSMLVVCNKKDEAEFLFSRLRNGADMACHLSASMCTEHRRNVLAELKCALEEEKKCLCVATQVIEAGVDISFHRVIRLAAGMDSVIQAAGRCNRHGESAEPVPVYVVTYQGEDLSNLREIREAKYATQTLLEAYRRAPERYENDLSSELAIKTYYQKLYQNMNEGYQDYFIQKLETTLFDLLTNNVKYYDESAPWAGTFLMNQAFKLAGSRFEVFDDGTRDLIVPYGEGSALITELAGQANPSTAFMAEWSRRARPYTVAVQEWQLEKLGSAVLEYAGVMVLSEGFYNRDTGLVINPGSTDFLEV